MTAWFEVPSARPLPRVSPAVVAAEPTPLYERIRSGRGPFVDDRPTAPLPFAAVK